MSQAKHLLLAASGSSGSAVNVENVFAEFLYAGNAGSNAINNGIDLSTDGGMVIIKRREDNGYNWKVMDAVRGANKSLELNTNAQETTETVFSSFNTNGFNFTAAIISDYHLKSLGKLVQLVGRTTGGKKYTSKMTIFCSNRIKETVSKFNERQKEICSLNPESFNSCDFNDSNSTIPIKLEFRDMSIVRDLIQLRSQHRPRYKSTFHDIIKRNIRTGGCIVYDYNNMNRFNIKDRKIGTIRMYDGQNDSNRRFKQFNDAFRERRSSAQECKEDEYCVDMAAVEYVNGDFTNPINIIWITFRI